MDDTFKNTYTDSADLAKWLERPVLIQTYAWQEGTSLNTSFNPWYDYFNNAKVKNKLENYTFLQANLNIKMVINASPFFYGTGLVAYEPLPQYKPSPIVNSLSNEVRTVGYSQRPHFWFYPSCNQGGHMLLPFINKEDWLDVTTAVSMQNMGKINLISPANLLNANGVSGATVSIQFYAWAQDVRLCGPTMSAALQGSDEYSTEGIISEPASAIAEAASCLESVPVIGPYATATSFVMSTVASVASWFGWTNAPVIESVQPFKDLPFHSMSSAEISQPVEKLTLDPKNELTVDPRTIGLTNTDELVIADLVTKESFLGVSTWTSAQAFDTQLFAARILPEYLRTQTITNVAYHQLTPLAWLSHLYTFWRGDIIFRFRFICSKYHKGRVIFSWDPDANISTTAGSATTNFSRIVDISSEPDVEIRCNYMQATTYLKVDNTPLANNLSFDATTVDDHNAITDNGILTCRVFTEQTSPVSSADIQIMVSVRGADNLEFAAPKEISYDYSLFATQGDELEYGAPPEIALTGEGTGSDDKHKNLVYMGETMKSLRQLLRRTSLSRVSAFTAEATNRFNYIKCRRARYPLYYGFDPKGIDTANEQIGASTAPFNFVTQHPLNWVRMAYLGSRGSVRWMYNLDADGFVGHLRSKRVMETRTAAQYEDYGGVGTALTPSQVTRELTTNLCDSGSSGQSVLNQQTQTGLCVEYPMYNRFRMQSNSATETVIGFSNDESDIDTITIEANLLTSAATTSKNPNQVLLYAYCSAGTDYTCLYFLNVPTLAFKTTIPTAV